MKIIEGQIFDEERALYGSKDVHVRDCRFDGPRDGDSAFKECARVEAVNCYFNLRYPFWHCNGATIEGSEMTALCRAALWYSNDISINDSKLHGIKALRECHNVTVRDSSIVSTEFGWFSSNISMENSSAEGEYFMMRSSGLNFSKVSLKGKYSFQYISDSVFEDCVFDTKDAFWHARNVVVRNCTVKGEYLAWYCENVTFENCVIYGTQPLCYCKGLKLINCEMHGCDLSFEKSQVEAALISHVISIKNPESGRISLPSLDELIRDEGDCIVTVNGKGL